MCTRWPATANQEAVACRRIGCVSTSTMDVSVDLVLVNIL